MNLIYQLRFGGPARDAIKPRSGANDDCPGDGLQVH
jgi:hypothetical protein